MARRRPSVQVVTSARRSASDDISVRQRRYLVAMTIRTLAVVLAFFVFTGWLRWVCLALGMVLPWVSVTSANAGPLPTEGALEPPPPDERPALPPGGRVIEPDGGPLDPPA